MITKTITQKKSSKRPQICLTVLLFLSCGNSVFAQSEIKASSQVVFNSQETNLLLEKLDRKIEIVQKLDQKVKADVWINPQEKENTIVKLDQAKDELRVFISKSLEQRCKQENRLPEIAEKVKAIDPKFAEKYTIQSAKIQK